MYPADRDADMQKVIKLLKQAVSECICMPRGDPIQENLVPATTIVEALAELGVTDIESNFLDILTGDNIEQIKYLFFEDFSNYSGEA